MTTMTPFPVQYTLEENSSNPKINIKKYEKYGQNALEKTTEYTIQTYEPDAGMRSMDADGSKVGGLRPNTFDRDMVCFDDTETHKYRSVIWNQGKLLCFSPPKSIPFDHFKRKYPDSSKNYISEIVEGTMINLFYDFSESRWEIATKNAIGGHYWYFSDPQTPKITFREMFLDAIGASRYTTNFQDTFIGKECIPGYCYSFVLQHPANRFVYEEKEPMLYLIAVYKIEGNTATLINNVQINELKIYTPEKIKHGLYQEIDEFMSLSPTGFMLVNTETGERSKLETPEYSYKKQLRGNNPRIQYQYLCLLKIGKIPEFLYYFPEYTAEFQRYHLLFYTFVVNIHSIYYNYYIKKQRDRDIVYQKQMMYFVKRIHHEVYCASCAQNQKIIITKQVLFDWLLANFEPHVLWYHTNFVDTHYV